MNLAPLPGLLSPLGISRAPAAPPFTPDQLTSLRLWLAGYKITGVSGGAALATWTDGSTHANDATQASAPARPTYLASGLNGLPVVRFEGGQLLVSPLARTQPYTAIVVVKEDANAANQYILDGMTINTGMMAFPGSGIGQGGVVWTYDGGGILSAPVTTTNWNVIAGEYNGASSRIVVNNGTPVTGTMGAGGTTGTTIGAGGDGSVGLVGEIAELIICDGILATGDWNALHAYLSSTYGLGF